MRSGTLRLLARAHVRHRPIDDVDHLLAVTLANLARRSGPHYDHEALLRVVPPDRAVGAVPAVVADAARYGGRAFNRAHRHAQAEAITFAVSLDHLHVVHDLRAQVVARHHRHALRRDHAPALERAAV